MTTSTVDTRSLCDIFQALSGTTRLRILRPVQEQPRTIKELVSELNGPAQGAVTRLVQELERVRLVYRSRVNGRRVVSLNTHRRAAVIRWLDTWTPRAAVASDLDDDDDDLDDDDDDDDDDDGSVVDEGEFVNMDADGRIEAFLTNVPRYDKNAVTTWADIMRAYAAYCLAHDADTSVNLMRLARGLDRHGVYRRRDQLENGTIRHVWYGMTIEPEIQPSTVPPPLVTPAAMSFTVLVQPD